MGYQDLTGWVDRGPSIRAQVRPSQDRPILFLHYHYLRGFNKKTL